MNVNWQGKKSWQTAVVGDYGIIVCCYEGNGGCWTWEVIQGNRIVKRGECESDDKAQELSVQ